MGRKKERRERRKRREEEGEEEGKERANPFQVCEVLPLSSSFGSLDRRSTFKLYHPTYQLILNTLPNRIIASFLAPSHALMQNARSSWTQEKTILVWSKQVLALDRMGKIKKRKRVTRNIHPDSLLCTLSNEETGESLEIYSGIEGELREVNETLLDSFFSNKEAVLVGVFLPSFSIPF